MLAASHPHTGLQAFQSVQPVHPLPIDEPTFAPQQHPDPEASKLQPGVGQITNAEAQRRSILGLTAPTPRGSAELR